MPHAARVFLDPYHENRGFQVLAPGYPGFEAEVEALKADPGRWNARSDARPSNLTW
jgi:hypothetical protein